VALEFLPGYALLVAYMVKWDGVRQRLGGNALAEPDCRNSYKRTSIKKKNSNNPVILAVTVTMVLVCEIW